MINREDLTTKVQYQVAKNGNAFQWIGYVEVNHDEQMVFHENLTYKPYCSNCVPEEMQTMANAEAEAILAREDVQKLLNDYVDIKNKGLY